jgi:small subunit ribosomal protein S1
VYVSDISWSQHIKHPGDHFTKGQEIEAVIIDINQTKKKIALSIKNLTPNPWDTIQQKLSIGDMVNGTITKIADFGAFVKLDNIDIEAFIHLSECSDSSNIDINNILKVNNNYLFKVIRVSPEEQKIGLSLKKEGRDYDSKKYDKKNSEKENRKSKDKNEGSQSQNKKDFNKKNQDKAYTTGADAKKKSNLQLEVEKLMQQNKHSKE